MVLEFARTRRDWPRILLRGVSTEDRGRGSAIVRVHRMARLHLDDECDGDRPAATPAASAPATRLSAADAGGAEGLSNAIAIATVTAAVVPGPLC